MNFLIDVINWLICVYDVLRTLICEESVMILIDNCLVRYIGL